MVLGVATSHPAALLEEQWPVAEAFLVGDPHHGKLDGVQAQVEQHGPDPGHNHIVPARPHALFITRW